MTVLPSLENSSAEEIGNKAFALVRLVQNGLPVPPFFCLSVRDLASLDPAALSNAIAQLGTTSMAVRSSGVDEDRPGSSFAGMYTTRLNVIGIEQVRRALEEVRDSAHSPAAMAYRKQVGIAHAPRIAATVQKLIPAEASGALFTSDPMRDSETMIVEGCWGLGEALVGGMVTPDRWILSGTGEILSATASDKDIASVPKEDGGTKLIEVEEGKRRELCLDSQAIHTLRLMALECERLFGGPQDVEWAIASNKIWLLQSRPISILA
jgi:pyruvate,water dikinase